MQNKDITKILRENPYPGRGIAMGITPDGAAVMVYFIMGRSENSRNRVFTQTGNGIKTQAANPAKLTDASLIIYAPVRKIGACTVVTNGDQTDTIIDFLQEGKTFEDALRTRTFEPDAPNFTPRISGIMHVGSEGFNYKLAILKSEGEGRSVQRIFFDYEQPLPGSGHFIHTYAAPANPLPPFMGEPVEIQIPNDTAEFANNIWESLNDDNKISLFVRSISKSGEEETFVFNKYNL